MPVRGVVLLDRPLAVVTAGTGSAAAWPTQQDELAALSSNSTHRTVAGATHASLIDDPTTLPNRDGAIRDVVRAVRKGSWLMPQRPTSQER